MCVFTYMRCILHTWVLRRPLMNECAWSLTAGGLSFFNVCLCGLVFDHGARLVTDTSTTTMSPPDAVDFLHQLEGTFAFPFIFPPLVVLPSYFETNRLKMVAKMALTKSFYIETSMIAKRKYKFRIEAANFSWLVLTSSYCVSWPVFSSLSWVSIFSPICFNWLTTFSVWVVV